MLCLASILKCDREWWSSCSCGDGRCCSRCEECGCDVSSESTTQRMSISVYKTVRYGLPVRKFRTSPAMCTVQLTMCTTVPKERTCAAADIPRQHWNGLRAGYARSFYTISVYFLQSIGWGSFEINPSDCLQVRECVVGGRTSGLKRINVRFLSQGLRVNY